MEQSGKAALVTKTALVLGATGGVGGEVARTLVRRGWRVLALQRDPAKAAGIDGVTWIAGDAMVRGDVVDAARGADVIVHAVNPPGYRDWDKLVLPMLDNTIAAAAAAVPGGARILLPGTIYNYGSGSAPVLSETTPQQPSSRKGDIRVRMEQRLREAALHGVKALVVRSGDFFGPRAGNSWFSQGLVTPGQALTKVTYPGAPGVGHAWAYLPDLADTMVRLLEQEARLDAFDSFHFRGHVDHDGTQLTAAIMRVAGNPAIRVRRLPWTLLRLLSPFSTFFREAGEMRYLWEQRFELDNAKLLRMLGSETHTPLDEAMLASLRALGCLPEGVPAPA